MRLEQIAIGQSRFAWLLLPTGALCICASAVGQSLECSSLSTGAGVTSNGSVIVVGWSVAGDMALSGGPSISAGIVTCLTGANCSGFTGPQDCNGNGIPDGCDIESGTSPDLDGNGIPDECIPPPPEEPPPGLGGHGQRYLEVSTPGSVGDEVIRVKSLSTPGFGRCSDTGAECIVGGGDCPTGTCSGLGGADVLYVGVPFVAEDGNSVDPSITFMAAQLECEPVPYNFGASVSVAVYGAEVIPSSHTEIARYAIQRSVASCPNLENDETCWSVPPLIISQGLFGDIVSPFFTNPGDIQPDFKDITLYVNKFLGDPTAPSKAEMQLQPNVVRPHVAVDFKDIAVDVGAFLGTEFNMSLGITGLCTCPSSVTCGIAVCSTNNDCVGDQLCRDGWCVDRCGRCSPQLFQR